MLVCNKSAKVIGIGSLVLLPDVIDTLPAGFEDNPVVKDFIKKGILVTSKGTGQKEKVVTKKAPKVVVPDPDPIVDDDIINDEEEEITGEEDVVNDEDEVAEEDLEEEKAAPVVTRKATKAKKNKKSKK